MLLKLFIYDDQNLVSIHPRDSRVQGPHEEIKKENLQTFVSVRASQEIKRF